MNGVHDMGGTHGFGRVVVEEDEPVFHGDWEARVFALAQAVARWRWWTLDEGRYTTEKIPPARYLAASYYERWLWSLESNLLSRGHVSEDELVAGRLLAGPARQEPPLTAGNLDAALRRRGARLAEGRAPRFGPGDEVVTRNFHPRGHTRLPRYARSKRGTVHCDRGVFAFADAVVAGRGSDSQHLYSVRFTAEELWGESAAENSAVHIDLFEDYLEPVR